MRTPKKQVEPEPTLAERASEYCRLGEEAAFYIQGMSDALEMIGDERFKYAIHHLREHAHRLSMETLYVEHGYREPK